MKHIAKKSISFILMLLLVMSFATTAFAADSSITFTGFSSGFEFQPGSEYTATDLFGNFKNVMPGDTVSKIVTVENTGDHPLYLRVKLTEGVSDEALTADDCLSININRSCWLEKDGYYYYYRALQSGETTEQLFSEVYFDIYNVDNKYIGKYFTLNVSASAVQSENNGADVLEAIGWPEEEAES